MASDIIIHLHFNVWFLPVFLQGIPAVSGAKMPRCHVVQAMSGDLLAHVADVWKMQLEQLDGAKAWRHQPWPWSITSADGYGLYGFTREIPENGWWMLKIDEQWRTSVVLQVVNFDPSPCHVPLVMQVTLDLAKQFPHPDDPVPGRQPGCFGWLERWNMP